MSSLKTLLVATCLLSWAGGAFAQANQHFHPKGKPPSEHTLAVRAQNAANLLFQDERDFEEQARGFIAAPPYMKIMADAGHVAWDMERYQFLLEGEDFGSIHPSLLRQAILNMNYGSRS